MFVLSSSNHHFILGMIRPSFEFAYEIYMKGMII